MFTFNYYELYRNSKAPVQYKSDAPGWFVQ